MVDVSLVPCSSYADEEVKEALKKVLSPIGGLDWVRDGMKIAIKANLVSMMKPETAATTHPALLKALVKILCEKGADVVIGDSPGGLYNAPYVGRIYSVTGMHEAEKAGARLNQNYATSEAHFSSARIAHDFTYTAYLDDVDAIIDFCKLKTHGMMGMSGAVKNMFGVIPGTFKPEYHFRYPDHRDFASMMIDLNDYFAPKTKLCIMDGVVGMEGNGPTQGTPRKIGVLLAAESPHALDLVAAHLIGLGINDVPTLTVAHEESLIPETIDGLNISGTPEEFAVSDYKNIHVHKSLQFEGSGKFAAMFVRSALRASPRPNKKECIGCKKCAEICPAKVITLKNGKPVIDRKACITCFCCQEFCPVGAMKVHRPFIARLINRQK